MTIKLATLTNLSIRGSTIELEYKGKEVGIFAYDEFYEMCFGGWVSLDDWKRASNTINQMIADEVDKGLE